VLDRDLHRQVQMMTDFVAPGGLEAFRRLAAWGSVVEETPGLASLQILMSAEGISEAASFHDYVVRRYELLHDLATGLIRQGIERGEIRPDVDADWEARALIAFLDGIRLQWFYSGRSMPLAAITRRYLDQLVARLQIEP
jgi:hypothetical protein